VLISTGVIKVVEVRINLDEETHQKLKHHSIELKMSLRDLIPQVLRNHIFEIEESARKVQRTENQVTLEQATNPPHLDEVLDQMDQEA